MATVSKLMREYQARLAERDTPELKAWRIRNVKARAQARADFEQAYPVVTSDNFQEAVAFQDRRIRELMTELTNGMG